MGRGEGPTHLASLATNSKPPPTSAKVNKLSNFRSFIQFYYEIQVLIFVLDSYC
jgi:hypothetical protein